MPEALKPNNYHSSHWLVSTENDIEGKMRHPTADDIANCVITAFDHLPAKRKPRARSATLREWIPLAGIVLAKGTYIHTSLPPCPPELAADLHSQAMNPSTASRSARG